jgi:hypothetical protein
MITTRTKRYSMLDQNIEGERGYEKKEYCQKCLKLPMRILSVLTERSYPDLGPTDPIPPDHDKWRQCPKCGSLFGIHVVKRESKLLPAHGFIPESPADISMSYVGSIHKRNKLQGRETRLEKKAREAELASIKDDDVKRLLGKGEKLLSYYQDDDKLER